MSVNGKTARDSVAVWYSIVVVLFQCFYLIMPFRQMVAALGLGWFSAGLALLGGVLFLWDVVTDRVFLKAKCSACLIATIGVLCLSSLVYFSSGWVGNAKVIVWQVVQMLVIYPVCKRMPRERLWRVLRTVYLLVSVVFAAAVSVSLYQFITMTAYTVEGDVGAIRQGFQEGRLFGIFSSVYFASLLITLLATIGVFQALKAKRIWLRVWGAVSAVLFVAYVVLSGTRSVVVGVDVAVFLAAFFLVRNRWERKRPAKKPALRCCACLLAALTIAGGLLAAHSGVGSLLKEIPAAMLSYKMEALTAQNTGEEEKSNIQMADDTEMSVVLELEREDIRTGNISNNRFQIWFDYLHVTARSAWTLLFGNSPGNYMPIIRDSEPDLYIVSYIRETHPLMYDSDLIYDTHNCYISVFVTSGILGVIVFGSFLVLCAGTVLGRLFRGECCSDKVVLLMVLVVTILISAFFDSDLFFKCTSTSVVFWMTAGLLMNELDTK